MMPQLASLVATEINGGNQSRTVGNKSRTGLYDTFIYSGVPRSNMVHELLSYTERAIARSGFEV